MNNSEQIFAIALGLEKPWSIKEIIFDQDKSQFKMGKIIFEQELWIWQDGLKQAW